MISKEIMLTIIEQNKRSRDAGNLDYTRQVLDRVKEKEPYIDCFIEGVSEKQAEDFCLNNNLGENEAYILIMMMKHIGGIVANAFISQREIEELEN